MTNSQDFQALTANPVFYRSYSRKLDEHTRESWSQVCDRTIKGLAKLGKLTDDQVALISKYQRELKVFPSGRWLWVGGTNWSEKPDNYVGCYNCNSANITDWDSFGHAMNFAMQGTGTGTVLEEKYISQLPEIREKIDLEVIGEFGSEKSIEETKVFDCNNSVLIIVGDSRKGWVQAYLELFQISSDLSVHTVNFSTELESIRVLVDVSYVRKSGEPLKGFGGTANPIKLPEMFQRVAKILNGAVGRKLTVEECCLLLDVAAMAVVAGNIRRSASMRQFDAEAPLLKLNLWKQDANGNWAIDPDRDVLRMANHTRNFHKKPTLKECIEAVSQQYHSGEGAIQFSPEAIARANADLLDTSEKKKEFLTRYDENIEHALTFLHLQNFNMSAEELEHRMNRYGVNPCSEVIGNTFFCNLAEVHLNQLDPFNLAEQREAFTVAAWNVAALLNHKFTIPRYQRSRELDPIVGVSFTGVFDFFVKAFGVEWLQWWEAGRPGEWLVKGINKGKFFRDAESFYFRLWRDTVRDQVWAYCDKHNLKRPNRYTVIQPAGTKSLLTGASPGFHAPKSARYIRRITFAKNDPVALACIDLGYSVVPSQSDKDENGQLLNDPFDPRCTEWLVEIPIEMSWANLPGTDQIDISKFSALAQFDFLIQCQQHYCTHTTSNTIELREDEIEELGERIYKSIQNEEGYVSTALLARFDSKETYPRLPFEPISKETYDKLIQQVQHRKVTNEFHQALQQYDSGSLTEAGPMACDSDKCLLPETR